ncbi:pentatricopeptide repeat-containing protein At4g02750-like [Selaginella moellendorffii]|uniref:pentatricopeptide repeat-containing protein At4g02750-like n=1 Tax=Selaginella moellendorffii TaxID=88036 RepID=UPI000D1C8490|nr:pentatricopeptide repeat-containing protein At4g02750-like [Selaginella moellendorffii]|eukprot:XP_024522401.1 pentatricopeptide repeat-containing protein At4g02750-like [Selaginella moellendorffii]
MLHELTSKRKLEEAKALFDQMPHHSLMLWNMVLTAYARSGYLEQARIFFEKIPQKDIAIYNSMLTSYGRADEAVKANQLFDKMPAWDSVSWNSLLAAYACIGDVDKAKRVFDKMPEKILVSWNTLLTTYVQNRNVSDAIFIFHGIPVRDLITWNVMLSVYAHEGRIQDCFKVFQEMPERDQVSWNSVLGAVCSSPDHINLALQIFHLIPMRTLSSYNTLLHCLCEAGLVVNARELFDRMPERDLLTWNTMIATNSGDGSIDQAQRVFDEMKERSLVSFTCIINLYSQAGNMDMAKNIFFCDMPCWDLISSSAMLTALSRHGDLIQAEYLLEKIPRLDMALLTTMIGLYAPSGQIEKSKTLFSCPSFSDKDEIFWNSMLSAIAVYGQLQKTESFFQLIPNKGVVTWTSLMKCYAMHGYVDRAKAIFVLMPEHDAIATNTMLAAITLTGDISKCLEFFHAIPARSSTSWSTVIAALARADETLDRARDLFDRMPVAFKRPWSGMMGACCRKGDWRGVIDLFSEMSTLESPDELCFVALLIACSQQGGLSDGRAKFASMGRDFGMAATKQHYSCLIDLLGRAGYLGFAKNLIESMPFFADSSDWLCLLGSCIKFKDFGMAIDAARQILRLDPRNPRAYVFLASICSSQEP